MSETTGTNGTKRISYKEKWSAALAAKFGVSQEEVLAAIPKAEAPEQSPRVKNLDALIAANAEGLKTLAAAAVAAGEGDPRKLGIFVGHDGSGTPIVHAVYGREARSEASPAEDVE